MAGLTDALNAFLGHIVSDTHRRLGTGTAQGTGASTLRDGSVRRRVPLGRDGVRPQERTAASPEAGSA
jgi:hypothetical protein